MTAGTVSDARNDAGSYVCTCEPARICEPCAHRGYKSGLAGYAARIFPAVCTPADEARELRVHYVAPDDGATLYGYPGHHSDELVPYDTCANCGTAVIERDGSLVTMLTGNAECCASRYVRELAAHEAHIAAIGGRCSHGGHDWDDTCSDIDDALSS